MKMVELTWKAEGRRLYLNPANVNAVFGDKAGKDVIVQTIVRGAGKVPFTFSVEESMEEVIRRLNKALQD